MREDSFDYVVIGAGSAGCVLAARLSEDPDCRVLLLEAGGPDRRWDFRLHMPAAMGLPLQGTRYNWAYRTEPQAHLDGRRLAWPRGRVLGGSSSINGMAYVRGNALDYDGWAADPACRDWGYANVLPYFRRAECYEPGGDAYRGGEGPLKVSRGRGWSPLYDAFVEAGVQAGYPRTPDMNGFQQEGFGRMDMTVHRGRRWSTARAYLDAARRRPNLAVETGAQVARLTFEGRRCTGAAYGRFSRRRQVRAEREVLLCAGAIGSAQLLLLSGIGPRADLARVGIDCRHHLPGVGANLQDHLELYVQHRCRQKVTLHSAAGPLASALVGLRWLTSHSGPGASSHYEAGGFIRSRAGIAWPDIQYHFMPVAIRLEDMSMPYGHSYQVHAGPMRSLSRGWLKLRSDRPEDHPAIQPDCMSHPEDWLEMRACLRLTREILSQPAMAAFDAGEIAPGPDCRSDADLDRFVRAQALSAYHPAGTCAMGSGEAAVLDGELRVRGLERLRVVDASAMPVLTTGNLNAPVIMIAEKAADLIRGRRAAPLGLPFYRADPSRQR